MEYRWSNCGSITIPSALSEACARWPDKVFLDFSGETYTYAEVDRASTRIAHGLMALGIAPGDRVCSMLDNGSDAVFTWFAVNKLGAIFVPINTDMKGEFLRHQLADAEPEVVIAEGHYAGRILAIENGIPGVHTLVCRGPLPDTPSRLVIHDLDSIRSDNLTPVEHSCRPGDLALLIYTSGTTGPSKGCMVSHNYVCNFAARTAWAIGLVPDDVLWTPCPLFHMAAASCIVISAMLTGATASVYRRFSVSNFWPEIERSRATVTLLISVMLSLVPNAPDTEASRRCRGQLRLVWGGPLNAQLITAWKERFGVRQVACPSYAMSEAGLIVATPVDTPDVPAGSSGGRIEDFDVRIVDDDGEECPPGVPGEIILRPRKPDIMFQGYWRRPNETLAVSRNFWFHTGDIGKFDEKGFFYFVDRKKDYLRYGGENISSFEVESAFLAHPDVAEVAVHAVLSAVAEDELKVTAVLKPDVSLTEEALCRWSLDHLPHFAIPRFIEFRAQLPRTATGRVQKFELRSQGVTETTWDRHKSNIAVSRR
ncbi:ATP-dependent acyl-CoA ligase [Trinickia violacea]|uniref:ATP-dependent acyl-CoA ligase n=1 Tax=Trinickia violacea TaxID=2571746 RepID=A0A4P8IN10_9BURK|nr:AMP-binding protein [Trinickia violacea]QCP50378.1 ATP-dependent acyl-CoA ligase [Trinickia violacea]